VNIRIQSLKVWRKFVLPWLKYSIFDRGLFFIGAPCILTPLVDQAAINALVYVSYRGSIEHCRTVHAIIGPTRFLPRDAMLARYMPSSCVCVCIVQLYVCHTPVLYQNG